MNWAKGRANRGRGTSFKGALTYVLHDKGAATRKRVGRIDLVNLATDDPDRAWGEMMALCEAADDLKRRAGIKATGRKLTKPVYAFTLNWHEADKPNAPHMHATAIEALRTLGLENHQAVIVEHTDRPHKHVHVIVNLIDPDTGKTASLSNDEHKLDRWADDYEQTQGVIRSPDRRAKFEALDNGIKPPKRPVQPDSREEWEATRNAQGERARERAAEIKSSYVAKVAALKTKLNAAIEARKTEANKLWKAFKADRKGVMNRYQPFIDAIWKSRRKTPAHPSTEQALRDIEETAAWKELGRKQYKQNRQFNARERSLLGVIANIVRIRHAGLGRSGLVGVFMLLVSGSERRQQFNMLQEMQKKDLRQRQASSRKVRADMLKGARRHELDQLSRQFERSLDAMKGRHAAQMAKERSAWNELARSRKETWAEYHKTFSSTDREPTSAARDSTLRGPFNDAARGDNISDPTRPNRPKKDWRARRSADERKADGTYRQRQKPLNDRGRGIKPER